jgi:hypothetical protein
MVGVLVVLDEGVSNLKGTLIVIFLLGLGLVTSHFSGMMCNSSFFLVDGP